MFSQEFLFRKKEQELAVVNLMDMDNLISASSGTKSIPTNANVMTGSAINHSGSMTGHYITSPPVNPTTSTSSSVGIPISITTVPSSTYSASVVSSNVLPPLNSHSATSTQSSNSSVYTAQDRSSSPLNTPLVPTSTSSSGPGSVSVSMSNASNTGVMFSMFPSSSIGTATTVNSHGLAAPPSMIPMIPVPAGHTNHSKSTVVPIVAGSVHGMAGTPMQNSVTSPMANLPSVQNTHVSGGVNASVSMASASTSSNANVGSSSTSAASGNSGLNNSVLSQILPQTNTLASFPNIIPSSAAIPSTSSHISLATHTIASSPNPQMQQQGPSPSSSSSNTIGMSSTMVLSSSPALTIPLPSAVNGSNVATNLTQSSSYSVASTASLGSSGSSTTLAPSGGTQAVPPSPPSVSTLPSSAISPPIAIANVNGVAADPAFIMKRTLSAPAQGRQWTDGNSSL